MAFPFIQAAELVSPRRAFRPWPSSALALSFYKGSSRARDNPERTRGHRATSHDRHSNSGPGFRGQSAYPFVLFGCCRPWCGVVAVHGGSVLVGVFASSCELAPPLLYTPEGESQRLNGYR